MTMVELLATLILLAIGIPIVLALIPLVVMAVLGLAAVAASAAVYVGGFVLVLLALVYGYEFVFSAPFTEAGSLVGFYVVLATAALYSAALIVIDNRAKKTKA